MNGFFQSIKTCGALLNKVRAVLSEFCRRVVGTERVVARVFTAEKAGYEAPPLVPSGGDRAPATVALVPTAGGPASDVTAGETNEKIQEPGVCATLTVSGPVCRMEVALGYMPPARGIPVILRELERA